MSKSEPNILNPRLTSIRKVKSLFGLKGRATLTAGFVRRHLWVTPILALIALVFTGTWLRAKIEEVMQQQLEGQLQTLLNADVTALELWLDSQENYAKAAAQDPQIRQAILELVRLKDKDMITGAALVRAPQQAQLAADMRPWLESLDYAGYIILDRDRIVLASNNETLAGQDPMPGNEEFAKAVFGGRAMVSRPFSSVSLLPDEWGRPSAGVPTMFAAAPVKDDQGSVVAAIGLRIRPSDDFSRILNVARAGESGETYAFDKQGVLLSQSRFEDQLKRIGLQADQPNSRSVLALELRDPGVDMTEGERPMLRRQDQPLTRMAQSAVAGHSGVDVHGYRDYRGVESVSAWTWLPEYGFGVVTEYDKAEAFRPVIVLRTVFWTLFGLLSVAAAALLGLTLLAGRLERRAREAVIAAGQLGQYALEEKIGEGGMGSVYRARHAMLRRSTAVKLLEPSKTTDVSIARFEREVQLTSQLNHPNTIIVYDYGRTQEGVFYYAMEYLDGFSLQSMVDRFGPQPDGRVIEILVQVCGSLVEAHGRGLIHRDIKPANIMLTQRCGVQYFVKLLDFGLVKAIDANKQTTLTAVNTITGTPLYMSPESIEDSDRADSRSDLYSLGAVAYFLLTGRPVFDAKNVMEIIRDHVSSTPIAPSARLGRPVSPDLEQLVLACLAKSPADRPASAAQLAEALTHCVPLAPWTAADADRWWAQYMPTVPDGAATTNTAGIDLSATLGYSELRHAPRPAPKGESS